VPRWCTNASSSRSHTIAARLFRTEDDDFQDRDDVNWMKHSLSYLNHEKADADMKYRRVHMEMLTNELETIPPQKRVY
jgi:succinate dehydrogenase/fumarate reductase flavoprotein subunit